MPVDCTYEDWTNNQGTPLTLPAGTGSLGGPTATDWVLSIGAGADLLLAGNRVVQAAMSPRTHLLVKRVNASSALAQFTTLKNQQVFVFNFSMTEPQPQQNSVSSVAFTVAWLGSPSGSAEVTVTVSYSSITGLYTTTLSLLANGATTADSVTGNVLADGGDHQVILTIGGFFWQAVCGSLSVLDTTEAGSPINATTYVELAVELDNRSGFNFGASPSFETLTAGIIELPDSDICVAISGPCTGCVPFVAPTPLSIEHWADREYRLFLGQIRAGGLAGSPSGTANTLIAQPTGARDWFVAPSTVGSTRGRTFVRHQAPVGAIRARLRASLWVRRNEADDDLFTIATVYRGANGPWDGTTPAAAGDIAEVLYSVSVPAAVSPAWDGPFDFEVSVPIVAGQVQFVLSDEGPVFAAPAQRAQYQIITQAQGEAVGGGDKYELLFYGGSAQVAPHRGQPVPVEPGGTGNGSRTAWSTRYPYAPHSLRIELDGVGVGVYEADPTTGAFELSFAPDPGESITATYQGAA